MSSAGFTVSVAPLQPWPPHPGVADQEYFDTLEEAMESKGHTVRWQEVQDGMMWDADLGGGLGARIERNLGRSEQVHVMVHPTDPRPADLAP
jgi:hypothetical protein